MVWLVGGVLGLGTEASWGPQLASANVVHWGSVGNLMKPLSELPVNEVNVIPWTVVDARYRNICKAASMWPFDVLYWYAGSIVVMVVISGRIVMDRHVMHPTISWKRFIIFSHSFEGTSSWEIRSTRKPNWNGVAWWLVLHCDKLNLERISRVNASCDKWLESWSFFCFQWNFCPRNQIWLSLSSNYDSTLGSLLK